MPEAVVDYYVLFHSHTDGLLLYQASREQGISVRISPAPRQVSACCGMSLLVEAEALAAVKQCIEEHEVCIDRIVPLPRQIDPTRDRYC